MREPKWLLPNNRPKWPSVVLALRRSQPEVQALRKRAQLASERLGTKVSDSTVLFSYLAKDAEYRQLLREEQRKSKT